MKIDKQILGYIQNYTTDDSAHYNEGTNFAIDFIQETVRNNFCPIVQVIMIYLFYFFTLVSLLWFDRTYRLGTL